MAPPLFDKPLLAPVFSEASNSVVAQLGEALRFYTNTAVHKYVSILGSFFRIFSVRARVLGGQSRGPSVLGNSHISTQLMYFRQTTPSPQLPLPSPSSTSLCWQSEPTNRGLLEMRNSGDRGDIWGIESIGIIRVPLHRDDAGSFVVP